jgi:hypothetical protein
MCHTIPRTTERQYPLALRRARQRLAIDDGPIECSRGATSNPMPAPSMPRVAAISATSGSVNSALLMTVTPLSRIEQSAANAKPDFTMGN